MGIWLVFDRKLEETQHVFVKRQWSRKIYELLQLHFSSFSNQIFIIFLGWCNLKTRRDVCFVPHVRSEQGEMRKISEGGGRR